MYVKPIGKAATLSRNEQLKIQKPSNIKEAKVIKKQNNHVSLTKDTSIDIINELKNNNIDLNILKEKWDTIKRDLDNVIYDYNEYEDYFEDSIKMIEEEREFLKDPNNIKDIIKDIQKELLFYRNRTMIDEYIKKLNKKIIVFSITLKNLRNERKPREQLRDKLTEYYSNIGKE